MAVAQYRSAADEAEDRARLVDLLLSNGDLGEAEQQLLLMDALGALPSTVALQRAWLAVLFGRPDDAAVRIAMAGQPDRTTPNTAMAYAEATVALHRGDAPAAERLFTEVPGTHPPAVRQVGRQARNRGGSCGAIGMAQALELPGNKPAPESRSPKGSAHWRKESGRK